MNTKIMIAVTVAALSLATTAFAAGEGGRGAFDAPALQSSPIGQTADVGSQQYPTPNPTFSFNSPNDPVLPTNGQNGIIQTANSLPRGWDNGTPAYMEAQSVNRWFAQQAEHRFAQAHPAAAPRG